jgi:hypothetical protein
MKEVSCKVLPVFIKDMEKHNLPLDLLCKNIPYDLNYLRNGKNNIEWDAFCEICLNTRSIYNDDDYLRLGKQGIEWRVLPVLSSMLGFFLNSKEMYRLMFSNKRGINSQLFRCITSTMKEIDENHIELLSELPEGYRYCKDFKRNFYFSPFASQAQAGRCQYEGNEQRSFF